MKELFLIKNTRFSISRYLAATEIVSDPEISTFTGGCAWCNKPKNAIHFTSEEEAQATIDFIINVIDEQHEEYLEITKARE